MKKQKIKVGYYLASSAIRNYFLDGNKQEEYQSIEIETENQLIIDKAELINNEYLEIKKITTTKILLRAYYYKKIDHYPNYDIDYLDFTLEEIKKDNKNWIEINKIKYSPSIYYSKKLLTEKDIINILTEDYLLEQEIDTFIETTTPFCEANTLDYNFLINEVKKEKALKAKEEKEKQDKINKERKKMIDDFVDNEGSKTLKLRKELGYKYEGLAIQEKCDELEKKLLKGFNLIKINYDPTEYQDVKTIDKPSLRFLLLIKKLQSLDFIKKTEPKIMYFNYDDKTRTYPKIEIIEITYIVFNEDICRKYDVYSI
jgi:hypothetical protein